MDFAAATPAARHRVAVAARKLTQATEPAYSGLVPDGATNNYDAQAAVDEMIEALGIEAGGELPANAVVHSGTLVVTEEVNE